VPGTSRRGGTEGEPASRRRADPPDSGPGAALFQVVRFWSRRWAAHAARSPGVAADDEQRRVQDIVLLDAVDGARRGAAEVAVTDIAAQLGIDRSGASRLVTDAAGRGYVVRGTSDADARRAVVTATPDGQRLLASARAWQEEAYARLTADWDPADAARFGGYLRRLADQLGDSTGEPAPDGRTD